MVCKRQGPTVGQNTVDAAEKLNVHHRYDLNRGTAVSIVARYAQDEVYAAMEESEFIEVDLEHPNLYAVYRRYLPETDLDEYTVTYRPRAQIVFTTIDPLNIRANMLAIIALQASRATGSSDASRT